MVRGRLLSRIKISCKQSTLVCYSSISTRKIVPKYLVNRVLKRHLGVLGIRFALVAASATLSTNQMKAKTSRDSVNSVAHTVAFTFRSHRVLVIFSSVLNGHLPVTIMFLVLRHTIEMIFKT